jgi:hypothetical protein
MHQLQTAFFLQDEGGQRQGPPGSRSSKKDDLDIITIEAGKGGRGLK